MKKVFGIGWAKTGTKTLGKCFEILGYRNRSQDQQALNYFLHDQTSDILELARAYDSFEDWPWLLLFKELDKTFPDSKFILTTRCPSNWIRSYRSMLKREGDPRPEKNLLRCKLYGLPFPDVSDEALCRRVLRHDAEVQTYFQKRGNLLVVDWERGDGWGNICRFLGKPLPSKPFPHENRDSSRI